MSEIDGGNFIVALHQRHKNYVDPLYAELCLFFSRSLCVFNFFLYINFLCSTTCRNECIKIAFDTAERSEKHENWPLPFIRPAPKKNVATIFMRYAMPLRAEDNFESRAHRSGNNDIIFKKENYKFLCLMSDALHRQTQCAYIHGGVYSYYCRLDFSLNVSHCISVNGA